MKPSLFYKPSLSKGFVVLRKPEEIEEMRRSAAFSDHRVSLSNGAGGMPLSNTKAGLISELLTLALKHRRVSPARERLVKKVINCLDGKTPNGEWFAWAEAGNLFDDRERAALAWAETVTRVAETGVPDQAYVAARSIFEERELVDLTIAIRLMNAYNRMAISFPKHAAGSAREVNPARRWIEIHRADQASQPGISI
jgi:alkylhydroperoxidase family enzyme